MNRFLIVLAFSLMTSPAFPQNKADKLNQLLQAYAGLNKLNGSVLISQQGKIILNQGYGLRDLTANIPNDSASIFCIGSLTKQFTAVTILKLQMQKKLSLHDRLSAYFPGLPYGDSITIEHLLTHTSGIYNYTDDNEFMQSAAMFPITEEKMLYLFRDKPLYFPPGAGWAYSNSNYVLLGYIIARVCHKPYEQVIRDFILTPLQMNSTGFDFAGLVNKNKAKGYKTPASPAVETFIDSTVSFAAGSMYSTIGDLYKWQAAANENYGLDKASFTKLTSPVRNKYGYGIYIDSIYGKRLFAHGGLTFGFSSYMGRIIEDDVCIILLNNTVNTSINEIASDVLAVLYDQPYTLPQEKKEMKLDAAVLHQYPGTYQLSPQFSIEFMVEGDILVARPQGQPKVRLSAEKDDVFFIKGADVQVIFKRDSKNTITGLVLIEEGKEMPGKKVK